MSAWSTHLEEPLPPGASPSEVDPELWSMVDPLWCRDLAQDQKLRVFKAICVEYGWYQRTWPEIAKRLRRGNKTPPNRLTTSQRSQQAKRASHSSWARTWDPASRTQKARQTFLSSFEREVDPDMKLPVRERIWRAEQAKKAYFARLALKSSLSRSSKVTGHGAS